MKKIMLLCTLSLIPSIAEASYDPDHSGLRRRGYYAAPPISRMGPIANLRDRNEQMPECASGGFMASVGSFFKVLIDGMDFKLEAWPSMDNDSDSDSDSESEDDYHTKNASAVLRASVSSNQTQTPPLRLIMEEQKEEASSTPSSEATFNWEQKNASGTLIWEDEGVELQSKKESQKSPPAFIAPVKDDIILDISAENSSEEEDNILEDLLGVKKRTVPGDTEEDEPTNLAPLFDEFDVPKDEITPYRQHLEDHKNEKSTDLLSQVDSPQKCGILFDLLNSRTPELGLKFSTAKPFVIHEFVKYLRANPTSFIGLRALLCMGHDLNPTEMAMLLSIIGDGTRGKTDGGSGRIILELTPSRTAYQNVLVAIAARFATTLEHLNITMTIDTLPDGFELLRPSNLKIVAQNVIEDDQLLNLMESIIKNEEVNIQYGDGQKLTLK